MITVSELRNMTVEKSAEMVIKDLETRLIATRHMPDYTNSKCRAVDLPWSYPKDITNVVMWELLESGYDVAFYQVDGGLRISIKFFA